MPFLPVSGDGGPTRGHNGRAVFAQISSKLPKPMATACLGEGIAWVVEKIRNGRSFGSSEWLLRDRALLLSIASDGVE